MDGEVDSSILPEKITAKLARREVMRTLGKALWRFRWRTLAALALLVSAKLLMVAVPVALKHIVDALGDPRVAVVPVVLLVGYAVLRFAGGLFTELRDMVFALVTHTTIADFTLRMFNHLQSLSVRFHTGRQTGVLARDLERGTAGVGFLLTAFLFTVLPTLVEIVAVVTILILGYSLGFAWIVTATFILYAVFTAYFTEKRIFYQRRLNELDSRASGQLVDSLLNFESVKYYASTDVETRRLGGTLRRWIAVAIENQKALSRLHVGQSAIIGFGVAGVMLLAGSKVVQGEMTVGDLVLVNAYMIQICLPLNTLGVMFRQVREALISAERMANLLRLPVEMDPEKPMPPLQLSEGEVRFIDVSFGYEPGRPILHKVDFTIAPGQTVAVVGGSGSGKSTLARLLLRFYDAQSGSILIDGQDIKSVSQASLREAVGIVPQDTTLFNNTIGYNIAYGRRGSTREEVIEAAKAACVHDFIMSLPAQYETRVGERGVRLSGGERQRIAIARTLLKNPSILIFDEATSALDSRTEQAIQTQLDAISQGRTTLVIAHRLSTIVDADLILVMEQGRVVERGRHADLLRDNKLYAHMWRLQLQQDKLEQEGSRLTAQPVNLLAVVAGMLDHIRPLAEEKGIHLYTMTGPETVRVTADPSVLQQLVWELCINAIVATSVGGRIALRLEKEGGAARLSITDERPPPRQAASIEEETWQVNALHVPPDPVRMNALIEQMGGRLIVVPPQTGTGMTYIIELPLRAVASLAPRVSDDLLQDSQLEGLEIFVVDDLPEARELVSEVLGDYGAQVHSFASGPEVLEALETREAGDWPQVLVCDISLGDMDGYQVIERLRAMEVGRGISLGQRLPAIALSGHGGHADRIRALLAGFQVYLSKPVDTRELVATVLSATRKSVADPVPHQQ